MADTAQAVQLQRLEDDMEDAKGALTELGEASVEYRIRLENGTRVFAGWDKRISGIEARTAPKPTSIYKIVGLTFTLFTLAATALWGLSSMLQNRPTMDQLEQVMSKQATHHDELGHKDVKASITAIKNEQGAQRTLISGVSTRLDTLLLRIPAGRKRSR